MNPKRLAWISFILLVGAQWYVPYQTIAGKERILKRGEVYAFACAPVDPSDPFRGKYIDLNFKNLFFEDPDRKDWSYDEKVYLILERDPQTGEALIQTGSRTPPAGEQDYLEAKVNAWDQVAGQPTRVYIDYPFQRFYLEEGKAKPVEERYREYTRSDSTQAYALVSILNGQSVIFDVVVEGESLVEIIKREGR